jgi:hypothetical protein
METIFNWFCLSVAGIVVAILLSIFLVVSTSVIDRLYVFFKTKEYAESKLPLWEKATLEKGCCTDLMTTLCAADSLLVRTKNLNGIYTNPRCGELRWDGFWWRLWTPDNMCTGKFAPGDEIEFIIVDKFISKKK